MLWRENCLEQKHLGWQHYVPDPESTVTDKKKTLETPEFPISTVYIVPNLNISLFPDDISLVLPDILGRRVPSDHLGIIAQPMKISYHKSEKFIKYVRPIPESGLETFGRSFVNISWDYLNNFEDSTALANEFESQMQFLVNMLFPLKKITNFL